MPNEISAFLRKHGVEILGAVLSIAVLIFFVQRISPDFDGTFAPAMGRPHSDLGFSMSAQQSYDILSSWLEYVAEQESIVDKEAALQRVVSNYQDFLTADSFFAVVIAIALWFGYRLFVSLAGFKAGKKLLIIPIGFGLADVLENLLHYFMVGGVRLSGDSDLIGLIAPVFTIAFALTVLKWILFLVSILSFVSLASTFLLNHKQHYLVALIAFGILFAIFNAYLFPYASCRFTNVPCPVTPFAASTQNDAADPEDKEPEVGHFKLQLSATSETSVAIVEKWIERVVAENGVYDEVARSASEQAAYAAPKNALALDQVAKLYRGFLINIDFVFPVVYAGFLISIILMLTKWAGQKVATIVVALPLIAASADYVENTIHVLMLGSAFVGKEGLVLSTFAIGAAFIFTLLKWGALIVALPALIISILWEMIQTRVQSLPSLEQIRETINDD